MRKIIFLAALFIFLSSCTSSFASTNDLFSSPRIKVKDGASTNWSGYAALTNLKNPLNGVVSDVRAQWTIPTVICTNSSTYSSAWVGIDGYANNTVEQTGTEHDCINGKPQYSAWYEMYPKFPKTIPVSIKPGDVIAASVHYLNNNNFQLTITNQTTQVTYTTTQKANAKRASAEWIVEAPSSSGGVLPLANFGTIYLSNAAATISGVTGTINNSSWVFDQILMTNGSTIKAQPSVLSPDGSAFTVQWLSQ